MPKAKSARAPRKVAPKRAYTRKPKQEPEQVKTSTRELAHIVLHETLGVVQYTRGRTLTMTDDSIVIK